MLQVSANLLLLHSDLRDYLNIGLVAQLVRATDS